jgi:hypothetical protein
VSAARRSTAIVALAVTVVLSLVMGQRSAEACNCLQYHATPVWPADGQTDVPVDTTLVIATSRADVLAQILTDPEGTSIPLRHIRTLDAGEACAFRDYVFVRPETALAPNTRYTITPSFPSVDISSVPRGTATSFTTGTGRDVVPTMSATLWLFADETARGQLMQVFASVTSDHPAFIIAQGEHLFVTRQVAAGSTGEPVAVPLGVVPCASVDVVDVTGTTRHSSNQCQPQKCGRAVNISGSTCGEHPTTRSWSDWQRVSDRCTTVSDTDRSYSGGCNVGRSASGSEPGLLLLVLLMALGLRGKGSVR